MSQGHQPVGRYDEIGSSDCPGPYAVHVVLVPHGDVKALTRRPGFTPADVRNLSVTRVYGEYKDFRHAFDVLAIFTDRRVSPGCGSVVETCARLPFAVCKKSNLSFDLIDAIVNQGFDRMDDRVGKWLHGSIEKYRALFESRLKEQARRGKKRLPKVKAIGAPVAIDVDRTEPEDEDTDSEFDDVDDEE